MSRIHHFHGTADMCGAFADILLFSGQHGTAYARIKKFLLPFQRKQAQRGKVPAGWSSCKRLHCLISLSGIRITHMEDKMSVDASGFRKKLCHIRRDMVKHLLSPLEKFKLFIVRVFPETVDQCFCIRHDDGTVLSEKTFRHSPAWIDERLVASRDELQYRSGKKLVRKSKCIRDDTHVLPILTLYVNVVIQIQG